MLITHLRRHNIVTGPLARNTSHSGLSVIFNSICGFKQFSGGEQFLTFGNALHERWLVNSYTRKVTADESKLLLGMIKALQKHVIACALIKDSEREQKIYDKLNGVEVAMILDIKQVRKKTGADLKTTACKTYQDFLDSAIKYGYFRQGKTYKLGARLSHFYFIGVSKLPPHPVFILYVNDHPEEEAYAEQELKFLLYFYKHYGKTEIPIIRDNHLF